MNHDRGNPIFWAVIGVVAFFALVKWIFEKVVR